MEDKIQHSKPVPPFVRFCAANIPMVFDDSLSYYECLCALWKFIQDDVIDVINNNATVTQKWREELTEFEGNVNDEIEEFESDMRSDFSDLNEAFNTLKTWVETYFDNLDVQEEINNKLDAMVEDGTLDDIVESVLEHYYNSNVSYIFPKNWDNGVDGSGSTSLVKAYNKSFLIDTATAGYKTNLYEFLSDNGISKLDYVIISHYDVDHIGNVINLINDGYITTDTTVYLPAPPSLLNKGSVENEQAVKGALETAGITWIEPEEGDQVVIEDFVLTFLNCDVDQLVASGWNDYNNYSMIAYIEHCNKRVLYPGDCFEYPLTRIVNEGFVKDTIDLYVIEHHGINFIDYGQVDHTPLPFLNKTQPRHSFLPANTVLFHQNNISESCTSSYLKEIACETYAQCFSTVQTEFVSTKLSFEVVSGTPLKSISNAYSEPIIYVDCNTDVLIPDGSQERPFKDLPQAIGYCNGLTENAVIRLADGEYCFLHPDTRKKNAPRFKRLRIRIEGNSEDRTACVLKEGLIAYDSEIELDNLTFLCDRVEGCKVFGGKLMCYNCLFTLPEGATAGDASNGIFSHTAYVVVDKCKFEHLNMGMSTHYDNVNVYQCEFDDIKIPFNLRNTNISINHIDVTNVTSVDKKWFVKNGYCMVDFAYRNLWTGSTKTEQVTLSDDLANFDEIQVVVGFSADPDSWNTVNIHSYPGNGFAKNNNYAATISAGKVNLKVDSSDSTKVTITSNDWVRQINAKITNQLS